MSNGAMPKPEDSGRADAPRHVAIIMDGNGRWARSRMLPRPVGHREGVKSVRRIVEACIDKGVRALTLFAFSSENWRRPTDEVSLIMGLFVHTLQKEVNSLDRNGVRLRFIGDRDAFSEDLQTLIEKSEMQTRNNTKLDLVIAANYGGQWDITRAFQHLAGKIESGELHAKDITSDVIADEMSMSDLPLPDLFIRTGGEQRISNFLLWQLAYTELYFTDVLWPAFAERQLDEALLWYANRQRRFGRTGEQVEQIKGA